MYSYSYDIYHLQYLLAYVVSSGQFSGDRAFSCGNNSIGRERAGVPDNNTLRLAFRINGNTVLVR